MTLAVTFARIRPVVDDLFTAAAEALAQYVLENDGDRLALGALYPSMARSLDVAKHIALAVIRRAQARRRPPVPHHHDADVRRRTWA